MPTTSYKRGEVVLVRFPYSDLETVKKRPAVVVQDETVATGLDQWIVVQVSKNLRRVGDSRVPVMRDSDDGRAMGLHYDSVIVTDCIQTVASDIIDKGIGTCPCMPEVDSALSVILGLSVRPER